MAQPPDPLLLTIRHILKTVATDTERLAGLCDLIRVKHPERPMANPEIDTIIRAYLKAADAKKAAEAQYNQLREELMEVLDSEGLQKYKGAFAAITVCERKQYSFPPEIVRSQEILKAEEKAAIKLGDAKIASVTRYPRVTITE